MSEGLREQRGAALAMVVLVAVCFSIAAFTALILALSRARTKDFYKRRAVAQYAAEAGLVWATQRLWADGTYCGVPGPPPINGLTVTITVSPPCVPGVNHTLSSKVTF